MKTRVSRAVIASLALSAILLTSGIVSTRSLAGKTKIKPHQLTIFFTGDDWGSYKGACG